MFRVELILSLVFLISGSLILFTKKHNLKIAVIRFRSWSRFERALQTLAIQLVALAIIRTLLGSGSIALPISIIVSYIPGFYRKAKRRRELEERRRSWPMVVDQLASATASGLALHQALEEMQNRGPSVFRKEFVAFSRAFRKEGSLERALEAFTVAAGENIQELHQHSGGVRAKFGQLQDLTAMRIRSTILIARDLGGHEVGAILRNLSSFLRQRERTYNEISVRQSWIKNGAVLASLTPWLLLLVLSFQEQTIPAFNNSGGHIVLAIGLLLTVLAYLWISRISTSLEPRNGF